jgi:hypothetical protein
MFGPLLDERRPALRPAARTSLEALRKSLGTGIRRDIDAALGGVLEILAGAPGLLEVAGS